MAPNLLNNIPKWLEENKSNFVPPVCNYMMHGEGRLKVMFVGGPNTRKDFHLEEGEEFFYQHKGDMVLRIIEGGLFKDIPIKEGEVFQLPGKIPHSPQRFQDTMGLVIERERMETEDDCLRYYIGDSTATLYEEWFYCADLGTQIGPVIKRYFASDAHKTGQPVPGNIAEKQPYLPDGKRVTEKPFNLKAWLNQHMEEIQNTGAKRLWDTGYQSDIIAHGQGTQVGLKTEDEEVWLWQVVGTSKVTVGDQVTTLGEMDTLLVQANSTYSHERPSGSVAISFAMPWANKNRGCQHLG